MQFASESPLFCRKFFYLLRFSATLLIVRIVLGRINQVKISNKYYPLFQNENPNTDIYYREA